MNQSYLCNLPDELIILIFSFLPKIHLHKSVALVSKRFFSLTINPSLWRRISADGGQIPTKVLSCWIKRAKNLQVLKLHGRTDINIIGDVVGKYSNCLESLEIENSSGSTISTVLNHRSLLRIVKKCKRLDNIHFISQTSKFVRVNFSRSYLSLLRMDQNE